MYMILLWTEDNNGVDAFQNADNHIRLFTYEEANTFRNNHPRSDDMRIISIEE